MHDSCVNLKTSRKTRKFTSHLFFLVFLATDEPSVEIKLKEIFPEKIITFTKLSFDRKEKICIQKELVDLFMLSSPTYASQLQATL